MRRKNIFKILFFITVPLILLGATAIVLIISQGASVTNQGIVSNMGVLKINTDPANIQFKALIDGNPVQLLVNNGVNVEEGQHLLRIEATGMTAWEKTVNINRNVVTDVFAKLFPLSMAMTQVTNTNVDRAFFSNNGDFVYYVVKDSEFGSDKGIWKMLLSANNIFFQNNSYTPAKFTDLNSTILPLLSSNTYNISPSPDNNKLLLSDSTGKAALVITSQPLNQQAQIFDLVAKLGFYPEYMTWFNNSNSLIIKEQHALFEYNLESNVMTLIKYTPDTELIFSANNDQVIYLDTLGKTLDIYKSQTSTELSLHNVSIPQDIQAIFVPQKSDRYFTVQTTTNYQLLDLDKSLVKPLLSSDYIMKLQSPDGLAYIFQAQDRSLSTYTITENLGLNLLETKTSKLDLTPDATDILEYTPQSNFLLYLNRKEGKLYAYDRDGSNKIELADSPNIKNDLDFDNNAVNLVLLVQDETQPATPVPATTIAKPRTNLYRLNLVKTTP